MPGPLPKPDRRRRNASTIPTTKLPAAGREGRAIRCPLKLAKNGHAWWRWAWHTPQAAAWSDGDLYALARRAQLEDDLATLGADDFDLAELLGLEDKESVKRLEEIIGRLKALAGGRVSVMREMRELDNRFGLTPKGRADLRWEIVRDEVGEARDERRSEVRRLRAVDPNAVAGA